MEIKMTNKGIEIIPNTKTRIDKIGSGETKMDKVGDITTEIMTIRASMDMVGEATIITGNNRIIIEAKAVAGTRSKITISKDSTIILIGHTATIANTPSHNNTMTSNPDQRSHYKKPTYINCVTIGDILTINASLQVTLWLELNRLLIKADSTTTEMDKVNSCKGIMIIKTPMTSFFSKGGSRCH